MKKHDILPVVLVLFSVFAVPPFVEANQFTIDGASEERYAKSLKTVMANLPEQQRRKFGQAVFIISHHRMKTSHSQDLETFDRELREAFDGKTGPEVIAEAETIVEGIIKKSEKRKAKITSYTLRDTSANPIMGESFTCKGLLSTHITLAPHFPPDEDMFILGESTFIDEDFGKEDDEAPVNDVEVYATSQQSSDTLAIHIHELSMTMRTKASLDLGLAKGIEFSILMNNDSVIYAVGFGRFLSSFLLNKSDGLAVWTKSVPRSRSFLQDPLNEKKPIPSTYSTYLLCR